MKALTFELHLLEPLLATRLGSGDPNSAVSFDFIPGSMLRGMVIGHYARQNPTDATDETFRRLFLDGSVRFLNAYPQTSTGQRALPTPLSWRKVKDEDESIYDFAVETQDNNRQWQRAEQPFCYLWQSNEEHEFKTELCKPNFHINIHTSRGNRQKIVKNESTVFRYQALAPEQTFCGVILADQESDLEAIKHWLPEGKTVVLGGSHLAGYGQVRLQRVEIKGDWREYTPVGDDTDSIIVTLLSDALIRDPRTGAYVDSLEPVVGSYHEQAFVGMRVVGGFNRKWNLPLPQAQAIRAGSVFVYPVQTDLLKRLQALEVKGIGERRAEGLGRIAVNWHRVEKIIPRKSVSSSPPSSATLRDKASVSLARQMVERMLRQRLDRALIAASKVEVRHPPSNAQLSRMRIVVRKALTQGDPQIIIKHLDEMKKAARDQFHRARIGREYLDEWLSALAENPQRVWPLIEVTPERIVKQIEIGGVQLKLTDAMALEYMLRLIDQVLHKAQKEEEAGNE